MCFFFFKFLPRFFSFRGGILNLSVRYVFTKALLGKWLEMPLTQSQTFWKASPEEFKLP